MDDCTEESNYNRHAVDHVTKTEFRGVDEADFSDPGYCTEDFPSEDAPDLIMKNCQRVSSLCGMGYDKGHDSVDSGRSVFSNDRISYEKDFGCASYSNPSLQTNEQAVSYVQNPFRREFSIHPGHVKTNISSHSKTVNNLIPSNSAAQNINNLNTSGVQSNTLSSPSYDMSSVGISRTNINTLKEGNTIDPQCGHSVVLKPNPMCQINQNNSRCPVDESDLKQPKSWTSTKRKDLESPQEERPLKVNKRGKFGNEVQEAKSEIHGSGNLVVTDPSNCIFNIYQAASETNPEDDIEGQFLEWTGVKQNELQDLETSKIFEGFSNLSERLSGFVDCKKLARMLETPENDLLEKELRSLEGKKYAKSKQVNCVLVRWWRCNAYGDNVDAITDSLKEVLEDLRLIRISREVASFFS